MSTADSSAWRDSLVVAAAARVGRSTSYAAGKHATHLTAVQCCAARLGSQTKMQESRAGVPGRGGCGRRVFCSAVQQEESGRRRTGGTRSGAVDEGENLEEEGAAQLQQIDAARPPVCRRVQPSRRRRRWRASEVGSSFDDGTTPDDTAERHHHHHQQPVESANRLHPREPAGQGQSPRSISHFFLIAFASAAARSLDHQGRKKQATYDHPQTIRRRGEKGSTTRWTHSQMGGRWPSTGDIGASRPIAASRLSLPGAGR